MNKPFQHRLPHANIFNEVYADNSMRSLAKWMSPDQLAKARQEADTLLNVKAKQPAPAVANTAQAQEWYEPARGTGERKALMNALRPHAERDLGVPVEFVVSDLRVFGDRAFASVQPQRPGGPKINIRKTPGFIRGDFDPESMEGTDIQALYLKSDGAWVVMEYAIGASDVWFAGEPFCSSWGPVIADFCYPR